LNLYFKLTSNYIALDTGQLSESYTLMAVFVASCQLAFLVNILYSTYLNNVQIINSKNVGCKAIISGANILCIVFLQLVKKMPSTIFLVRFMFWSTALHFLSF
jgi:hypothetical protein